MTATLALNFTEQEILIFFFIKTHLTQLFYLGLAMRFFNEF